ncbi:TPA: HU family DNA-binding protein [Streptococcus agalactiae]|nr:hypothetical protein [Streptococcus agalactiae]HEO2267413.1 hypothetical protein [Streptococcus agalactiae]
MKKESVNERDIAVYIQKKYNIDFDTSKNILNDAISYIMDNVAEGKKVSLKRFGDIDTRIIKGGKIADNRFNTTITPRFKARYSFKKIVKEKSSREKHS